MLENDGQLNKQLASSSRQPLWPIYLGVTAAAGASAFLACVGAIFSMNWGIVLVSILTSILCFVFGLKLASKNMAGFAILLALAIAPITFGLGFLYLYTLPIQLQVVQKIKVLGQSIDTKLFDPQPALDRAIQAGLIRKATAEDLDAFRGAYIAKKYI